ncbi:DUF1349 domain-containing protein [Jidongwangia harbinensis]|uniref:DUF1349 domain-containing protein n=1 Tax=Jidongwangia harbinensis TaxID=2878561 RepID=UPI001CDA057B|nr:DUF1349 domain-containing protein [Jidongwangia harbinensis]MCA2211933.1 DUF1349 domain-containing protein [Jidongwangia harbinensis]
MPRIVSGRTVALASAVLVTVLLGLLAAYAGRPSCSVGDVPTTCPTDPVGPHGQPVSDQFSFTHRPLSTDGSITVRVTELTGIITHPPPDHNTIVPGVVPWAKAGLMIKDGTRTGSSYVALVVTGAHGVRLQSDYVHDVAGRPGRVSPDAPRWLRLTRSGNTVTGYESADGRRWTRVGAARVAGLPPTAEAGLFATSPGDLTLRRVALGGRITESRFTQATGTFDAVEVTGGPPVPWRQTVVGETGGSDWEKRHRPAGTVRSGGTVTVTGSGDVGPLGSVGSRQLEDLLPGLPVALLIVLLVAVRHPTLARAPGMAAAAFGTGLLAAGGTVLLGAAAVDPVPLPTAVRVVAGVAALFAGAAGCAVALRVLVRRAWIAGLLAALAVVVPYALAAVPLLPDPAAQWLLRVTPAAGFAVVQTVTRYPQVLSHYAPSGGYLPLSWWAGLAVLGGYVVVLLGCARGTRRRGGLSSDRDG